MCLCSAGQALQMGHSAVQLAVSLSACSLQSNLLICCDCPVVSIVCKWLSAAKIHISDLLSVLPLCVKGSISYGQWELLFLSWREVSHSFASFADTWAAKAGEGSTLFVSERIFRHPSFTVGCGGLA